MTSEEYTAKRLGTAAASESSASIGDSRSGCATPNPTPLKLRTAYWRGTNAPIQCAEGGHAYGDQREDCIECMRAWDSIR